MFNVLIALLIWASPVKQANYCQQISNQITSREIGIALADSVGFQNDMYHDCKVELDANEFWYWG